MASVQMKVSQLVNKLIADEWIARHTYEFQSKVCEGASFDAVSKRLAEMAADEGKHMDKLITWMQSKGFSVITNPLVMMREADASGRFVDFQDPVDTKVCVERGITSERNAKNCYLIYYKAVKDKFPDLAHIFMEIANEEGEHKVELSDLLAEIDHFER